MIDGMREIEYYALGTKKRLVYQVWVDEDKLHIHMKWNAEGLPGYQMQMHGFDNRDRLEERLKEMDHTLISVGYTQVPFGYTEGMGQFATDVDDLIRAESGVR